MYIHIGQDISLLSSWIVAVLDMDKATADRVYLSPVTVETLKQRFSQDYYEQSLKEGSISDRSRE